MVWWYVGVVVWWCGMVWWSGGGTMVPFVALIVAVDGRASLWPFFRQLFDSKTSILGILGGKFGTLWFW